MPTATQLHKRDEKKKHKANHNRGDTRSLNLSELYVSCATIYIRQLHIYLFGNKYTDNNEIHQLITYARFKFQVHLLINICTSPWKHVISSLYCKYQLLFSMRRGSYGGFWLFVSHVQQAETIWQTSKLLFAIIEFLISNNLKIYMHTRTYS